VDKFGDMADQIAETWKDDSEEFLDALKREYEALDKIAKERNQHAVMYYYPASGDQIRVGNVRLYPDSSILVFYGDDAETNPCVAIVPPQNAQLLLKIVTLQEEPDRKTIGFGVAPERTGSEQ